MTWDQASRRTPTESSGSSASCHPTPFTQVARAGITDNGSSSELRVHPGTPGRDWGTCEILGF